MSIDITIEEMETLPAESYELFDIRGEIERAHGILPNSVASSADALMENPPEDKEKKIIICCSRGQISRDIAEELQEQGYEAYSLKGGYVGWLMADMKKKEADDVCEHVELSIRKKFKKKIWSKFTKAVREYELVKEGDRIAVCISGGKDSMLMAKLFQELLKHGKANFELVFLVMNPGYNEINYQTIKDNAQILNVPITVFESDIFNIVASEEQSPCYLCARMRRGYLYSKAKELGCTHTHFANVSGLPDENHYSSAHDLAKIMRACLRNKRFRQVMKCSNYKIPATNLSEARVMHTHMPLMAKESNLYYADCIGGKTGFSTDAQHTLVTAAERNGRTYIAVTMRAADLGINCTDSTSLFNYAFDNFDTIDVDGTAMTVPKGVTVNDLTTDTAERNGKTLTRYYYSGQFVGYVAEAQPTETPAVEETAETAAESSETEAAETVTDSLETTENDSQAEVQTGQKSMSEQIQEIRTEGLSGMMKALLIAMGVMAVILIALLIALYIKNG